MEQQLSQNVGDKESECTSYGNTANIYQAQKKYELAEKYFRYFNDKIMYLHWVI